MASISRALVVVLGLTAVLVVTGAAPALASCAEPPPMDRAIADAATVFVGTVTSTDFDGRVATFTVEEVWKGDAPATVVVSGGPSPSELEAARAQGQMVMTSVDRSYQPGTRYLVVSHATEQGVLLDNACSRTQEYAAGLVQFRPATAHGPADGSPDSAPPADPESAGLGTVAWTAIVLASLGVLAGAGLAVGRWRRRHPTGTAHA